MTTFKEAQRIRSKTVARSKRAHKVPTEDQEQIALMSWAHHVKYGNGRLSDYLIHIPNGGSRNVIEAAKFKKMGVKAGVPDLQLLVPNSLIHGLWIELKSKKGKLQPSQRLMMQRLEEQGYLCKVCFGAHELREAVRNASDVPIDGNISISSLRTDIEDMFKNGVPKGLPIDMNDIDTVS